MTTLTRSERADRLDQFIAEGRLLRRKWTDTDSHGRELACLLAAWSPEVAETKNPSTCPADTLPPWLAHLAPWIDDAGSAEQWPKTMGPIYVLDL